MLSSVKGRVLSPHLPQGKFFLPYCQWHLAQDESQREWIYSYVNKGMYNHLIKATAAKVEVCGVDPRGMGSEPLILVRLPKEALPGALPFSPLDKRWHERPVSQL